MNYKTDQPIYLQIANFLCERILQGVWKPEERMPSVRELSVQMAVNPNTVVKSFEYLESKGIIFNKRGIGYFVERGGLQRIQDLYKDDFLNTDLPNVFKKMQWLNLSLEDIGQKYQEFCKTLTP